MGVCQSSNQRGRKRYKTKPIHFTSNPTTNNTNNSVKQISVKGSNNNNNNNSIDPTQYNKSSTSNNTRPLRRLTLHASGAANNGAAHSQPLLVRNLSSLQLNIVSDSANHLLSPSSPTNADASN